MWPFIVWLGSRLLLFVVVWSGLVAEPPQSGWRAFPDNPALDGWARWDSGWYADIATNGYGEAADAVAGEQRNSHFSPLYPLLMRALAGITGNVYSAGMLISNLCFLITLYLLYALACEKTDPAVALRTLLLVAFNPYSLYFSAVYTESLYLMLAVGAFYLAEKGRFTSASVAASFAGVTRVIGPLIAVAISVMYLRQGGRKLLPLALGFVLPVVHVLFLYQRYGTPFEFFDTHFVEGWGNTQFWPTRSAEQKHWLFILLTLALSLAAFRKLGLGYGLWGTTSSLTHLASWTGGGRYAMVVFPATIVLAAWLRNRYAFAAVLLFYGYYMIDYALRFSHWQWVA